MHILNPPVRHHYRLEKGGDGQGNGSTETSDETAGTAVGSLRGSGALGRRDGSGASLLGLVVVVVVVGVGTSGGRLSALGTAGKLDLAHLGDVREDLV